MNIMLVIACAFLGAFFGHPAMTPTHQSPSLQAEVFTAYIEHPQTELIGQTLPISLTSESSQKVEGTFTISEAKLGRYWGENGTVISGEIHLPLDPNCHGRVIYDKGIPQLVYAIEGKPAEMIYVGYLTLPPKYILRDVTQFTCNP